MEQTLKETAIILLVAQIQMLARPITTLIPMVAITTPTIMDLPTTTLEQALPRIRHLLEHRQAPAHLGNK